MARKKRVQKATPQAKEIKGNYLRGNFTGNHNAVANIATNTRGRINIVWVENIKETNSFNRNTFLEIARSTFKQNIVIVSFWHSSSTFHNRGLAT